MKSGAGLARTRKNGCFFFDDSGFDTRVSLLLEKEGEMMPREDYLTRLHSGDLDVSARNDSVDWILQGSSPFQLRTIDCLFICESSGSILITVRTSTWEAMDVPVAICSLRVFGAFHLKKSKVK
ncbi:PREDICTED: cyclin-D1-1-like [Nelumbo nucifera]|uniref:Uncharacterized protein n=2 Tax=Nelumbo nucifera TaxID=4432 RepID=A0A822Y0Y4_NELNU|nr:PREDICTED: cyclin-D1-1-like [Nelumbo nucifera]DAD27574.1 TPA_asm: hypothetical protein HUJ06_029042 [Nelumbo nucifera]